MSNIIIEDKAVYMVWTKFGHRPVFCHETQAKAEAEADRLAALHPGKKFIVMLTINKRHVPIEATASEVASSA